MEIGSIQESRHCELKRAKDESHSAEEERLWKGSMYNTNGRSGAWPIYRNIDLRLKLRRIYVLVKPWSYQIIYIQSPFKHQIQARYSYSQNSAVLRICSIFVASNVLVLHERGPWPPIGIGSVCLIHQIAYGSFIATLVWNDWRYAVIKIDLSEPPCKTRPLKTVAENCCNQILLTFSKLKAIKYEIVNNQRMLVFLISSKYSW